MSWIEGGGRAGSELTPSAGRGSASLRDAEEGRPGRGEGEAAVADVTVSEELTVLLARGVAWVSEGSSALRSASPEVVGASTAAPIKAVPTCPS